MIGHGRAREGIAGPAVSSGNGPYGLGMAGRTHEAVGPSGFQDRRVQPLRHPSGISPVRTPQSTPSSGRRASPATPETAHAFGPILPVGRLAPAVYRLHHAAVAGPVTYLTTAPPRLEGRRPDAHGRTRTVRDTANRSATTRTT